MLERGEVQVAETLASLEVLRTDLGAGVGSGVQVWALGCGGAPAAGVERAGARGGGRVSGAPGIACTKQWCAWVCWFIYLFFSRADLA